MAPLLLESQSLPGHDSDAVGGAPRAVDESNHAGCCGMTGGQSRMGDSPAGRSRGPPRVSILQSPF